ncbi:MAG: type II toxin-antitoxin system prevent-host-death family antitoxin [bacterium]|nr:type II toxin-antitoxin system prevent-host-death family antitoxin [bacterium]
MAIEHPAPRPAWTVAEAKARLSEILRLAEEEGPQRIGRRKPFVVVPERLWREERKEPSVHMGRWLVENINRGTNLEIPDRSLGKPRPPFWHDWTDEDWGVPDE